MITQEIQEWSERAQQRFATHYWPSDILYFAYRIHPGVRTDKPSRRNYTLDKTFVDLSNYLIPVDDTGLWLGVVDGCYTQELYNRTPAGWQWENDLRRTYKESLALDLRRGEFFIGPYRSIGQALEGAAFMDELGCWGGVNEHRITIRRAIWPRCAEPSRVVISCERCQSYTSIPKSRYQKPADIHAFFTAIAGEECSL